MAPSMSKPVRTLPPELHREIIRHAVSDRDTARRIMRLRLVCKLWAEEVLEVFYETDERATAMMARGWELRSEDRLDALHRLYERVIWRWPEHRRPSWTRLVWAVANTLVAHADGNFGTRKASATGGASNLEDRTLACVTKIADPRIFEWHLVHSLNVGFIEETFGGLVTRVSTALGIEATVWATLVMAAYTHNNKLVTEINDRILTKSECLDYVVWNCQDCYSPWFFMDMIVCKAAMAGDNLKGLEIIREGWENEDDIFELAWRTQSLKGLQRANHLLPPDHLMSHEEFLLHMVASPDTVKLDVLRRFIAEIIPGPFASAPNARDGDTRGMLNLEASLGAVLLCASKRGDVAFIDYLISLGAKANGKDCDHFPDWPHSWLSPGQYHWALGVHQPLTAAAARGHEAAVHALLTHGAELGRCLALPAAVRSGNQKLVRFFLAQGRGGGYQADPNSPPHERAQNADKACLIALLVALQQENDSIFDMLLELGVLPQRDAWLEWKRVARDEGAEWILNNLNKMERYIEKPRNAGDPTHTASDEA